MTASDLIMAVAMLTAPVNDPEPVPHEDVFPAIRDAIHKTAVDWEIMDPRETRYVLTNKDDFEVDLNLLRKRYNDLKDAPKLADCNFLPDRRTVSELISFNRAFKKTLEERLAWENDRADLLLPAIQATENCYKVWDAIRDARCDFYYVTVRRAALKRLNCQYPKWKEQMPEYVPNWAFMSK